MARLTVYLPDELHQRARDELPDDLSWSSILAEGLAARLECSHSEVVCARCHAPVPPATSDPPT
jgi:hypothetical protein